MPAMPKVILTDELLSAIDRQFKIHGSLRGALRAIGVEQHYGSIHKQFYKLGDSNPYTWRSAAKRYERKTGETVAEAAEWLARTHTRAQIAEMLGFASGETLGKYLKAHGVHLVYGKRKAPDRRAITDNEAAEYVRLREEGMRSIDAAKALGRDDHRLRLHAYALFPDRCAALKARPVRVKRA